MDGLEKKRKVNAVIFFFFLREGKAEVFTSEQKRGDLFDNVRMKQGWNNVKGVTRNTDVKEKKICELVFLKVL